MIAGSQNISREDPGFSGIAAECTVLKDQGLFVCSAFEFVDAEKEKWIYISWESVL